MRSPAVDGATRQVKTEKVEPKPTSDEFPSVLTADWERERCIRFPHDRLVRSTAITHAQFIAMARR